MAGLLKSGLGLLAVLAMAAPARATEVCGWVVETTDKEGFHEFSLFLQADGEADIYYMMRGQGGERAGHACAGGRRGRATLPAPAPRFSRVGLQLARGDAGAGRGWLPRRRARPAGLWPHHRRRRPLRRRCRAVPPA